MGDIPDLGGLASTSEVYVCVQTSQVEENLGGHLPGDISTSSRNPHSRHRLG